jgi:LPS sulfotransferase NodH
MGKPESHSSRFVILAAPRSGSNMLCTYLNSHSEILCHHEIFNPDGIFYALHLRATSFGLGSIEERDSDPLAFLNRVWREDFGRLCVGFKLTHRQNEAVFYSVLRDATVKKIILQRKNRIKRFVSFLIAEKTGEWEAYGQSDRPERPTKVEVDLSALYNHIELNNAYYSEVEDILRSSGQPFLSIAYEELLAGDLKEQLLGFLGVATNVEALKVQSVKQNSNDLRDLISNFSELEMSLLGSDLEAELHSLRS